MSVLRTAVDKIHQFVVSRRGHVSILPKQPSGEPYVDSRYELEVAGVVNKGVIGPTGVIRAVVPLRAPRGELRIWAEPDETEKPLVWPLELGKRPPVSSFEGVRWRLENLGFDCGDEKQEGPETRAAVRAFEEWIGLKSAEEELVRTGAVEREAPITRGVRTALEDVYERDAGLHHGAELVGDDEVEDQTP